MQQTKRFLALTLALVLLVLASGCAGKTEVPQPSQPAEQPSPPPAASGETAPAEQAKPLTPITFNVGRLASGTYNEFFEYYDKKYSVIRETAREYGYDVTVNWRTFPVAPPMFAAMKAGEVDCGQSATFPIIAQISQGVPLVPLGINLGAFEFVMVVNKDSNIRKFEDLKGKKIGVAIGTAHQGVLETFLLAEFGKTAKELGIELVNQGVPVPYVPQGVDALQTYIPAALPAFTEGNLEVLVNMFGWTGEHYKGPLGEGAGIRIPSVQNSPFNPEGFAALRNFFVCPEEFVQKNPDLIKAFVIAHQNVIKKAQGMTVREISDYWPGDYWELMPRELFEERSLKTDLLYKHRDWIWPTDAEVDIFVEESKIMARMGNITQPLTRQQVLTFFARGTPFLKAAYEATGSYPSTAEFTKKNVYDFRGLPIWEVAR